MATAIIIAGGTGSRMHQDIPKQFINVYDKPVIIYTLEAFQRHPQVSSIGVVCIDGWHEMLLSYARQFRIDKLEWVISGGNSAQESIRNGIFHLEGKCPEDEVVIIHDGIRPLVEDEVVSDVILKCQQYGNGVTSLPYNEQIFLKADEYSTRQYIPRDTLRRVSTPQAYRFQKLLWAYKTAFEEQRGIGNGTYVNTLMVEMGETLYFASGSEKNIKLTSRDDLELFKSYLKLKPDQWLK
ncbi:MAG: 2-C-methyl-D-erythritol 4-phosphate cytidylyltransferase [Clostridiaceae bacterium]|nr:2-C-methyl-D-erythritol 4-phosphate cytidylyltransferase [Clostridiaceae bacterium]